METHVSEDIALEILTWLPAKSLMRFKCISKAWYACIGHPNFAKLHKARSQVRPSATRLLFELDVDHDYGSVYWPPKKQRPLEGICLELTTPHYSFYYKETFICSNHCNGLVCLYNRKDGQAYLYNVTTREIKAFPFSIKHVKCPLADPRLFLGFDKVTEKYKLLHVFKEPNTRGQKTRILTLGTNSWRIIRPSNFALIPMRCIYLDGVLYSMTLNGLTYFNFREEKFGKHPPIKRCSGVDIMQTALWGKLVTRCRSFYYDDLNKAFREFVNNSNYPNSAKVALLETERIDKTKHGNTVLATASIISAPTSLQTPDPFVLTSVSSFVENIVPLMSLF